MWTVKWKQLILLSLILVLVIGKEGLGYCTEKVLFNLDLTRLENQKVIFTLNGQIYFPVIMSCGIDATREQIKKFQADGFNCIYTPIDYPWIYSRDKEIESFLDVCRELNMPVIIELASWDYWHSFLSTDVSCNMMMSTGEYIRNYPDFANPRAKEEYLKRFRTVLEFLKPYFYSPIIAISIGPYDAYHIPDGEIHADFVVPEHTKIAQTWLPYGEYVSKDFRSYLIREGFLPKDLGFSRWEDVYPPTDRENAKNKVHWQAWMYYRREGYTLSWIKSTAELVKELTRLPVTMTLDLRPEIWEDWGTPGLSIANVFNFIIVYYYGLGPTEFGMIPRRLERISTEYNYSGVPLISLLEFSSALGGRTHAEDYILQSYPYVSGFQFGFFDKRGQGEVRYDAFVKTISKVREEDLWKIRDERAILAILLSKKDIYISEDVSSTLYREKIPYDVIYETNHVSDYRVIYIPAGQPYLEENLKVKEVLEEFVSSSGLLIEESKGNFLQQYLDEIRKIMKGGKI